jgi:hypothetical protein
VTLIISAIYSTGFSGLWLVVSIYQPQYGRGISSGSGWQITPSTATLLATLAAKTIELSFVTVFVAVLGQVLTRRAFSRSSKGVTLAEMTMRNWVIVSHRLRPAIRRVCIRVLSTNHCRTATRIAAYSLARSAICGNYSARCADFDRHYMRLVLYHGIRCYG